MIDRTGITYGSWTVLGLELTTTTNTYWKCRCKCGTERSIPTGNLIKGKTSSCGCEKGERITARITRHGQAMVGRTTPTYKIWNGILDRCTNPNNPSWERYGGRDIQVCERWYVFENFLADMGERPSEEHSIERIDNNGDYIKYNCRWATRKEQGRNKRNNVLLTLNGKTQCAAAWADELGVSSRLLRDRIRRYGWSHEDALCIPVPKHKIYAKKGAPKE